jgi:putative restriction endonuclease
MERRKWSRNELIVAFNLYCKTPFGRIHNRNPEIIALAAALGRTASAVSWKLANFARLDPALKKRNIAGASHGAKLEGQIWNEFAGDWERLSFESEKLRIELLKEPPLAVHEENLPEGRSRDAIVRVRINQGFFRSAILATYQSRCCITGLSVPSLLSASHIIPWSVDVKNRTNPRNGLCLNALHDRAFDCGLITVTSEYKVLVSPRLKKVRDRAIEAFIRPYDGATIEVPQHFQPEVPFLKYHEENVYCRA